MADEVLSYPKARLSKGAGDLMQVTDVTLRLSKGRKLINTLRSPAAGVADGETSNEMTFKGVLDENGFERDYHDDFEKGKVSQYRLKVPGGKTFSITGKLDDLEVTNNVGGAVEFSAKVIGKSS